VLGAAVLAGVAATVTILLYRVTLEYGFDYDDYHFVRPYSDSEVVAAFHGPWDTTGIEVPFYRPLTVAFFAARFEWFGVNSHAYHELNLTLTAIAAALAGWIAWRLSSRFTAGLVAGSLFIVHPALPYSLVAWVTNQMHGIEIVTVLLGLAWWHAVRRRSLAWWLPLLPLGAAAFLIKEDGIMLLPAIVLIHTATVWLDEDSPPVPVAFVVLAGLLLAGLFVARREFLHGLGGYHRPSVGAAWSNVTRGLVAIFSLTPADRRWQGLASWIAMALPIVALAVWRRTTIGTRRLFVAGALLAILFDLPFAFVSKAEQMHVVALGAVLVLCASIVAVGEAFNRRGRALVSLLLAGVTVAVFGAVAHDIVRDFEPVGAIVRTHDRLVTGWAAVPQELRDYLVRKLERDGAVPANPAEVVPVVAFGMHLPETNSAGLTYRWMASPRADLEITRHAREIEIPLRHEIGAFREPAHLTVYADGRLVDDLTLRDDRWHISRFAMRAADVSALRRTHRVCLRLDHAWRPALLIPGSHDTRTLGLQVGEIVVK
jgi:hypothetical protein